MTKAPRRLQELQRKREGQAQAAPSWRGWGPDGHGGTMATRREASGQAKANNGAPGIDGGTCEDIAASGVQPWRAPRRDERVARTYQPMRVRRQAILKDGGTTGRVLDMPTLRARVGPGALHRLLEPRGAAEVQPGSSGARPHRSAHAAVERVAEASAGWKTRGMDGDRQAYGDHVRHHGLVAKGATRVNDAAGMPRVTGILQASGNTGVPQGGGRSPWRSTLDLTEGDRMRARAQEVTRSGPYPSLESARCADARGRGVAAHRRHAWRLQAVAHRLREALAVLHVTSKEEKSRRVDLARGATCSVLGCDCRRVKSRRGAWRPWYTPRQQKRTALLRPWQERVRRYASQPVERGIDLINPRLRGWVRSGAVGEAHRCCGCLKDWVEKQVRRHLRRARHRQGCGWQRWRRRGRYGTWRVLHTYRVSRPQPKALPARAVPYPCPRTTQESAVREIRLLRVTRRERETWPWGHCEPTEPSQELGWKPST